MKATQPKPETPATEAPRLVVAVDLTKPLEFTLMANEPVDGMREGEGLPIFGYNLTVEKGKVIPIYYTNGTMPFCLREAEAEGDYSREVLFMYPPPATISEINMAEYPDRAFIATLTNAAIIPRPEPAGKVIQFTPPTATASPSFTTCKEVQHPASIEYHRNTPGKQLYLFETDKIQTA